MTDNPNARNIYGQTPIRWAARNGHTDIIKILAHLTDDPNTPDREGETPIHLAVCKGNTEIFRILTQTLKIKS